MMVIVDNYEMETLSRDQANICFIQMSKNIYYVSKDRFKEYGEHKYVNSDEVIKALNKDKVYVYSFRSYKEKSFINFELDYPIY